MILILHIISALSSLILALYTFFYPSWTKLHVVYGLTAAMLSTGTYLVYTKPTHLTQTCISGLVYLSVMLMGIFATRHKLVATHAK